MKHKARENLPMMRHQAAEEKQLRQHWCGENAAHLGKWLWRLFWLVILNILANLMTNENVLQAAPGLRVPGELLGLICGLAYGFILWQLRPQGERYGPAAVCCLASAAINTVSMLLGEEINTGLVLLLLTLSLAVSLYRTYQEYNAHAELLEGIQDELAENWRKLWKWEFGLLAGMFVSAFLVLLSAVLGMLALLAVLIGVLAVSVLKLMYLYRMAKFFREYIPSKSMGVKG